ncbi:MAG: hypothetical protein KGY81_03315, partial [Phycisphaerae bacterium]|nr:hypothetical protein [Phycisphaerae bacterium]
TDTAGVEAQQNWNNLNASSQGDGLIEWTGEANGWEMKGDSTYVDSNGSDTTLSLSAWSNDPYFSSVTGSANGDEKLLSGEAYGGFGGSLTVSDVPYDTYDLIVYSVDRAGHTGDHEITISDGSTTYYVNPTDTATDIHTQMSNTTPGSADEGTYVCFSGLSGSTTFTWDGPTYKAGVTGF